MSMATEWKLGRTGPACETCGKAFGENDLAVSVLHEAEGAELRRADYCAECFPPPGSAAVHSQWKGRRGATPRPRKLDLDQVKDLFEKTAASETPQDQEIAFFLGLLLVRKRRLRVRETSMHEGREILVLETPGGEGSFAVPNPVLTPERLEALDRELRDLLILA